MIRQKDFTYDPVNFKGLPEFVRSIKKDGLRYIIILVSPVFITVTEIEIFQGTLTGTCIVLAAIILKVPKILKCQ